MKTFRSNASEIKHHIRERLDNGREASTQDIILHVKNATEKDFTPGMLGGALNDLINHEPTYQRIRRGVYQKTTTFDDPTKTDNVDEKLKELLQTAITEAKNALRIDIATLTPERLMEIQAQSTKIITALEGLLRELEH